MSFDLGGFYIWKVSLKAIKTNQRHHNVKFTGQQEKHNGAYSVGHIT